jgi:hypothetical protein
MKQKFSWMYIGICLLFPVSMNYIFPKDQVLAVVIQYVLAIFLFVVLSRRQGFVLLIAYIVATALAGLVKAFMNGWNAGIQLQAIFNHIVMMFHIVMVYICLYWLKGLEEENRHLKEQVAAFMKYVGSSKVLTKQEFEERRALVNKAMERRGEKGYEIYFSLESVPVSVRSALFDQLTALAVRTFRERYDLVGKWDDTTFVVLLQNTDEKGMGIAMDRYFSKVKETIHIEEEEIVKEIKEIGSITERGVSS